MEGSGAHTDHQHPGDGRCRGALMHLRRFDPRPPGGFLVDVIDAPAGGIPDMAAPSQELADWNRRLGSFSRQWRVIRSSAGDTTLSLVVVRSRGSLLRIALIVSAGVSPLNARSPLSIS